MIFLKIIFSIISTLIIFYYTNLACPSLTNINDGEYFNNNSIEISLSIAFRQVIIKMINM